MNREQTTNKKIRNSKTGFTLLETLVAISILTLSIAAAFTSAQSGLSSAILARDQIIAFQLAQEAVELIKNKRDTNAYQGQDWLQGLDSCINTNCFANVKTSTVAPCISQCGVAKDAQGFYVQESGITPTGFKRIISLEQINANEVKIIVRMEWQKGSVQRSFEVNEHMFNWVGL